MTGTTTGGQRHSYDPTAFDSIAESYDRRDQLSGGWVTTWLSQVLAGRHGAAALELGCGTGRTAVLLAERYSSVEAIDLSGEMIRLASSRRPHPRVTYRQADLNSATGEFDLVVSILTLHHVPDIVATLHRIAGLVRPGGLAILVDTAEKRQSRWEIHAHHVLGLMLQLARRDPHAWEKFKLSSDRGWMDHLASDRFLTPEQFREVYSAALPGAVVAPVTGSWQWAAIWERPQ